MSEDQKQMFLDMSLGEETPDTSPVSTLEPPRTGEDLFIAKNLSKSYFNNGNELKVLKNIDLQIKKGEFLGVVGPSGAGKSTLLHLIGILDRPIQGEIWFENNNANDLDDNQMSWLRNKKIGFIFQFYHLLPEFNVLENVLMPFYIEGKSSLSGETFNKAEEILEKVGLKDRINYYPNQLSGGEQQRAAIARALVTEPALILADEPTGNLDYATGESIFSLLVNLNKERNQTIVMATHNPYFAKRCHRLIHLMDGRIV